MDNTTLPLRFRIHRIGVVSGLLIGALVLAICLSLVLGPVKIPLNDLFAALSGEADRATQTILYNIRAPRTVLALAVGASLAVSGACLQGMLRNPLADPSLIGITAGASTAVVAAIVLGDNFIAGLNPQFRAFVLPIAAFSGAFATTLIVLHAAYKYGQFSVARLILVGVAMGAIAMAMTGVLIYFSTDQQLRELTFWTMGSLAKSNWISVIASGSIILVSTALLLRFARTLDLFQLGERAAFHAGVEVNRTKMGICLLVSIAVGAGVAVAGPIGFIGLVAPHIVRLLVGSVHKYVLPIAAIAGAALMLIADIAVRITIPPQELPIGLATALLGGPFFFWLLLRVRHL
ncbi:MAG: iron ABC transporter permease [Pseudomonadota bacterium]